MSNIKSVHYVTLETLLQNIFPVFFLKKEFILGNKKYVELRYSTKYVPKDFTHDFLRPLFY